MVATSIVEVEVEPREVETQGSLASAGRQLVAKPAHGLQQGSTLTQQFA